MSQRAFLAGLDADIHAAFAAAGMADRGAYTAPGTLPGPTPEDPPVPHAPVDCDVFVDRDTQTLGETQQFKAGRVEVVYVLGSMTVAPAPRGQLIVDGDTYINDDEISNDGSLSRWVVRRG